MRRILNIKRFYFSNDPLGYLDRIKVKRYYDKNGNIIHTEELFKFNNLYVEETLILSGESKFGKVAGTIGLVLLYQHLPIGDNDTYKEVATEEYENYKKLDDDYNIVNNQLYDGVVYLDENDNFICSLGYNLGQVIHSEQMLTIDKSLYHDKHYSDDSKTYTIYQTKGNKTVTFERTLPKLYVGNNILLKNKDDVEECFLVNNVEIDTLIRTLKKDLVTIEYVAKDKVVFKESFYLDEHTISTSQVETIDEHFLGHNVSYIGLYTNGDEYRELWFEDLGEIKEPNDDEKNTPQEVII